MSNIDAVMKRTIKTESCWIWTGCKNNGHGQIQIKGRRYYVHRISYEFYKGEIPYGLTIDHLCRNRSCVNPDHLEAVTAKENVLRGISPHAINKQKTHCIFGHELKNTNLIKQKSNNKRVCRICVNLRKKKYRLNKHHIKPV